ncbi:MAG TPA: YgjV family protein [Acetobacteraceae bacterium]
MIFTPTLVALAAVLQPASIAGALAVAVGCSWPLFRTRRRMLAVQIAGSLLFALHFVLLGVPAAAAMSLLGITQGLAAGLLRGRGPRLGVFAATVLAGATVTWSTWNGLPSLCAQTSQLLCTAGRLQSRMQAMRGYFLAACGFGMTQNFVIGSSWGLASSVLGAAMLTMGLWRERNPSEALHPAAAMRSRR